jgi:hypothetical protein
MALASPRNLLHSCKSSIALIANIQGCAVSKLANIPESLRTLLRKGLWLTHEIVSRTPLIDTRTVWRFVSETSSQQEIEEFLGFRTSDFVERQIHLSSVADEIDRAIESEFPLLNGYVIVPMMAYKIPDATRLLMILYRHIISSGKPYSDIEVDLLLSELDALIQGDKIDFELEAPVRSLKMPIGLDEIILDDNVKLVALSLSESEKVFNGDFQTKPFGIIQRISTSIRITGSCPASISKAHSLNFDTTMHDETEKILKDVICSLMIVSRGKPNVEYRELRYPSLPISPGNSRGRPNESGNPFGDMELTEAHVKPLQITYKRVSQNKNRQIAIALERLSRSESRYTPIDGIIDAVIGLEALLTPGSSSEMTFRAQLNYSMISPLNDRKDRFKKLGELMSLRGKIVHGAQPENAALMNSDEEARNCLRHALSWCLNNDDLTSNAQFPKQFWVNFILSMN